MKPTVRSQIELKISRKMENGTNIIAEERKKDSQTIINGIIEIFGHCIATWYAMAPSLVKLTEIGSTCGRG